MWIRWDMIYELRGVGNGLLVNVHETLGLQKILVSSNVS